jgi:hypothetical protein
MRRYSVKKSLRRKTDMKRNGASNSETTPKAVAELGRQEKEKSTAPSLEQIAQRAFEIHLERGGNHGRDLDDWLQAERELQEK